MTTMAIFTLGANDLDKKRMVDYVRENWTFIGEYSSTDRLLHDAKTKKFFYILVYDIEALDDIMDELKKIDVEVLVFKDQEKLKERSEEEKIKRQREIDVKVKKDEELASINEILK